MITCFLQAVEERWDVLFSRFALLGAVNPEFREQSQAIGSGSVLEWSVSVVG